jgi:hypothetical protein
MLLENSIAGRNAGNAIRYIVSLNHGMVHSHVNVPASLDIHSQLVFSKRSDDRAAVARPTWSETDRLNDIQSQQLEWPVPNHPCFVP